jgi:aminotransferase
MAHAVVNLPPSGIRRFFDLVQGTPGVVSLGVGEPDFATPWHIREAGIYALEHGHTTYTANAGMPELRREIAGYIEKMSGAAYDPKTQVLVTVGASEAIDLACRALFEPGDVVLVPEPCFVSYAPEVVLTGARAVPVPTRAEDEFRVQLADLERVRTPRTKGLILNSPNNPTGAVLTGGDIEAIAQFVARHDLFLISDEIYGPLVYDCAHVSFTSAAEILDRLILVHGFSKAWAMTGWRVGFAAGPADIIGGMTRVHQYLIMCASGFAQEAATEALRNGAERSEEMRREYDRRRRVIVAGFNRMGLDCLLPQGAFYVFPSIRKTGLTSEEFCGRLLEQQKVAVVPGTAFGASGEGHIRASYATSLL